MINQFLIRAIEFPQQVIDTWERHGASAEDELREARGTSTNKNPTKTKFLFKTSPNNTEIRTPQRPDSLFKYPSNKSKCTPTTSLITEINKSYKHITANFSSPILQSHQTSPNEQLG